MGQQQLGMVGKRQIHSSKCPTAARLSLQVFKASVRGKAWNSKSSWQTPIW